MQSGMLIVPDPRHLALVERAADALRRCVPILNWRVQADDGIGAMAMLEALSASTKTRLVTGQHTLHKS